ncbi:MAG: GC-type dockerin domain-anchored protein [Phycisphaerales bacterium JB060]
MRIKASVALLLASCAAATAQTHEGDIVITAQRGVIETGYSDAGTPVYGRRVFDTAFGKLPNWTNDPGFDSPVDAFAPRASLGFDVLAPVLAWDGAAFTDIADSRILISKGPVSITTPLVGEQPGFVFGQASTTGKFHHHLAYELLDPASDGVYLLEMALWQEGGAVEGSAPFFLVFSQNASPDDLADAVAWVEATLIGAPCRADMDGDGSLTIFDFLAFQNLFDAGDLAADFDGDGSLTIFDFLVFQNEFDAGC